VRASSGSRHAIEQTARIARAGGDALASHIYHYARQQEERHLLTSADDVAVPVARLTLLTPSCSTRGSGSLVTFVTAAMIAT
jgi:hypothetical protein